MNFTAYVEEAKKKARLANIDEVRKDIDKPWVQEKRLRIILKPLMEL